MRVQVIIAMLHTCFETGEFSGEMICNDYNISKRTLRRYVSEINCYYADQFLNERLIYCRTRKVYLIR